MNKITKEKEFKKIYNKNKKIHTKFVIIFYNIKEECFSKFGIVASKKTGNAVNRNRNKRIIREVIRTNINSFNEKYDYILVAKSSLKNNYIKKEQLEEDILKYLRKIK